MRIPKSMTRIANYAFAGCSGLTSIIVENGNTEYDSRENCNAIINTGTNELVVGCKNSIIPNSVTNIGEGAFMYCNDLVSVTIPNSVISIGSYAFYGCRGLNSVTIGSGITDIYHCAFSSCRSLTDVYCYAEVVPNTDKDVFSISMTYSHNNRLELGVSVIESNLHVPKNSMSLYEQEYPWKLFKSIVGINQ